MEISVRKQDQILMSLVHYFVTKENYSPILVQGVKDEIWLENIHGPYRVIRINSNYIHNNEQFEFDQYKIKGILSQIKKKTFSFRVNALNINLNENDYQKSVILKNIDNITVKSLADIENNKDLLEIFPNLKKGLYKNTGSIDMIFNVTKDINEKTEKDNKKYEKIFSKKEPLITYILIGICTILFILSMILSKAIYEFDIKTLLILGANNKLLVKSGQIWRVITSAFLHGGIAHFMINMYSLYIIGKEIEGHFGKINYLTIYFFSALCGGLLSAVAGKAGVVSVGASGAIFGLMGALVYFGLCYRLYLKNSLLNQILPVIAFNLIIGFSIAGIDMWGHIGGLIGGFLMAMALNVGAISKKGDKINGIILSIAFVLILLLILFFI
ncbi:MAG: rhomboid family intramembrane serine protease [Mollicutes bacterium]|nr:rhomboid family intramembrane serine protease [Mollicutes bacterium]